MGKYIVKRILQVIPMLFILSLIVFMMVRLIPGDPVDMMLGMDIPKDTKEYERERLGLNDPLYIQYFRFVGNALHGDLGTSIFSGKPVVEELAKRFPKTLTLAVGGTLFGAAVGVLLGIIAAIHRNKFADNLIMVLSLLTVSTPSFFLALILMLIFCLNLRWLPSIGMDTWQGAILPIATLGLQAIGSIARTTRSAMLDVIHQDYIRTSRSRGVPERVMIAIALACRPHLLIADEPTTALDVTIQAQIMELIVRLNEQLNMGVMLITHDLAVVAQTCSRVIVMYLGQIVEEADVLTLFDHPCHPYTEGLMRSIPRMEGDRTKPLYMIPGTVPLLSQIPTGCRFAPRCAYATERCRQETPQLTPVSDKQSVRCFRAAELAQKEATAQ